MGKHTFAHDNGARAAQVWQHMARFFATPGAHWCQNRARRGQKLWENTHSHPAMVPGPPRCGKKWPDFLPHLPSNGARGSLAHPQWAHTGSHGSRWPGRDPVLVDVMVALGSSLRRPMTWGVSDGSRGISDALCKFGRADEQTDGRTVGLIG